MRFAYLIELADNEHPGCIIPGQALGVVLESGKWAAQWVDYLEALQFARKIDGQLAAEVLVPGMDVFVIEHCWEEKAPPAPSASEGRASPSPASIPIRVRDAHGTYTARCQGKVASCTGGAHGAAHAVARKVMARKGPFYVQGAGSTWRIIPEARQ